MYDEVNAPRQATASGVFYFFYYSSIIHISSNISRGREGEKEGGGQLSVIV